MGYILEDKMEDGIRANGWYGGVNKKYSDMFNLTASKNMHIFLKIKIVQEKRQNH